MIVRKVLDLLDTPQHVKTDIWTSTRLFVKADGLGFSLHETKVRAGTEQTLHYKNHIEAVIITEGLAELVDLKSGAVHLLEPGSAYALTGDRHIFRALKDLVCYCVFQPALHGDDVPDADGVYSD